MNIGLIVAARSGSRRLPKKAFLPLLNEPMICWLIFRLQKSQKINNIVFATTRLQEDDALANLVSNIGIPVYRGENEDVAKRLIDAADHFNFDYVVRVTGDCPFVGPDTLDFCLGYIDSMFDFDLATTKGLFPVGIDYEIYRASVLAELHRNDALNDSEKEHVTLHFYKNKNRFDFREIRPAPCWESQQVFTVDFESDYLFASSVCSKLNCRDFSTEDLVRIAKSITS